ncbi:MAG: methyltransferase domain-containing protein [Bacteroidota bacterium]
MNWQRFWDQYAQQEDEQVQVGRVSPHTQVGEANLQEIVQYILRHLDLQPSHRLLDVCCGNGLLTQPLAAHCRQTLGVDVSEGQIQRAQALADPPRLSFVQGNATDLQSVVEPAFDRINLYFSFQYLDRFELGKVAIQEMLVLLKPGGKLLIGDVPVYQHLGRFYPTPIKRLKYHLRRMLGREQMGKFWKEKEMQAICEALGVELTVLEQPAHFLYAHYRKDFLIHKPE